MLWQLHAERLPKRYDGCVRTQIPGQGPRRYRQAACRRRSARLRPRDAACYEGDASRRDRLFRLAGGDLLLVIGATDALGFWRWRSSLSLATSSLCIVRQATPPPRVG